MAGRRTTPFLLAIALLSALSGCTGNNASNAANSATATELASQPPSSPCDLPGGWFFRGACRLELVTAPGAAVALPAYRGFAVNVTFGANDAPGAIPFVVGDALGDGDITGRLNGTIDFRGYGDAKCVTKSRVLAPCAGKTVIYAIVVNAGRVRVRFKASPTVVVSSVHGFPGNQCAIATMIWGNEAGKGVEAWVVPPHFAVPNGVTLRFDSEPGAQTYASGGNFTVFAVVCR